MLGIELGSSARAVNLKKKKKGNNLFNEGLPPYPSCVPVPHEGQKALDPPESDGC